MLHHNTRRMRRTWSGRFPDDSSWITTEEQTVTKGKLTFITILVLFKPPWTHKITGNAYTDFSISSSERFLFKI